MAKQSKQQHYPASFSWEAFFVDSDPFPVGFALPHHQETAACRRTQKFTPQHQRAKAPSPLGGERAVSIVVRTMTSSVAGVEECKVSCARGRQFVQIKTCLLQAPKDHRFLHGIWILLVQVLYKAHLQYLHIGESFTPARTWD